MQLCTGRSDSVLSLEPDPHLQEGLLPAIEQEHQRRRQLDAGVRNDGARQLQQHPDAGRAVGGACMRVPRIRLQIHGPDAETCVPAAAAP